MVVDNDFDVVVAEAGSVPVRSQFPTERPMPATIGNTTELLVVLVDESPRMAGDISNRSRGHPVAIDQTVEAATDKDPVDGRARSTQDRAESIGSVSGAGSSREDLGFRGLRQPAW
jgi:hypothetical protein